MKWALRILVAGLLAVVVVGGLGACGSRTPSSGSADRGAASVAPSSATGVRPTSGGSGRATGAAGLAVVRAAALPVEAQRTLRLIAQGGPFSYPRDGVTFQNRERRLPTEPDGYYHEYTVPTPGAADRGARRIIAGKNGERYYTPDHYRTFMIVEGG